ncbi:MAG: antibiotic biosynthesis monooxygenase [Lautropia sp.]
MYTATFTFSKKQFDDEFHALDAAIATVAQSIPGYLGEEAWENPTTGVVSTVYYWETLDALHVLMTSPDHLIAKRMQARWLDGYQVIVAEVIGCYGDGKLAHPLAERRIEFPRRSPPTS